MTYYNEKLLEEDLKFLSKLKPFFKTDINTGVGYISNIYVNIDYLYQLSINQNLESLDKKEKNEIVKIFSVRIYMYENFKKYYNCCKSYRTVKDHIQIVIAP